MGAVDVPGIGIAERQAGQGSRADRLREDDLGRAPPPRLLEARGFTREEFAKFHPNGKLGRTLLLSVDQIMRSPGQMARAAHTCSGVALIGIRRSFPAALNLYGPYIPVNPCCGVSQPAAAIPIVLEYSAGKRY